MLPMMMTMMTSTSLPRYTRRISFHLHHPLSCSTIPASCLPPTPRSFLANRRCHLTPVHIHVHVNYESYALLCRNFLFLYPYPSILTLPCAPSTTQATTPSFLLYFLLLTLHPFTPTSLFSLLFSLFASVLVCLTHLLMGSRYIFARVLSCLVTATYYLRLVLFGFGISTFGHFGSSSMTFSCVLLRYPRRGMGEGHGRDSYPIYCLFFLFPFFFLSFFSSSCFPSRLVFFLSALLF